MKSYKGITLVALIITIAVLIIITAVSISAFNDNGIIAKAKEAKTKAEIAKEEEKLNNIVLAAILDGNGEIKEENLNDKFKKEYGEENFILNKRTSDEKYILKLKILNRAYEITEDGKVEQIEYVESRLPSEYQEVEWIKSNGYKSFFIFNININKPTQRIYLKLKQHNSSYPGNSHSICGFNNAYSGNKETGIRFSGTGNATIYFAGVASSHNQLRIADTQIYEVEIGKNMYINGELIKSLTEEESKNIIGNTCNFCLGGMLESETNVEVRCHVISIYRFIIYNNNIITHDMIPCYRKGDNKSGLYDIVNNVFYTNQGTGEFIVGPDVN